MSLEILLLEGFFVASRLRLEHVIYSRCLPVTLMREEHGVGEKESAEHAESEAYDRPRVEEWGAEETPFDLDEFMRYILRVANYL